jgi:transposase
MRPDAVAVLDAFHVVKLGTAVVDEVRRRVQQDTLGRRGHKQDPPFKIRGLLRHGVEHLTARQVVRLEAGLEAGDPDWAVRVAWSCYQQLRAIYHARTPAQRARLAEQVIATFPTCPIPEVARLGRTLRAWRAQVLAYFDTDGVSDGGTEAICECGSGWSGTGWSGWFRSCCRGCDSRSNWPVSAVSSR